MKSYEKISSNSFIPNGAMWTYDDNVVVPVYRKDGCKNKLLALIICSLYYSQAHAGYNFEQLDLNFKQ